MPENKQKKKAQPVSLSFSRLKTYTECPRAFKFGYIDKVDFPRRKITVAGRIAHKVFDVYTQYLAKKKLPTDITKMPEVVDRVLSHPKIPEDEVIREEVQNLADSFARGFVLNLDTFYGSEIRISIDEEGNEVDWWEGEPFFRGVMDYMEVEDNRAIVTDHKTGWAITKDKVQLETYGWMAHKVFPQIDTFLVQHYFVRYHSKRYTTLEMEDIQRAERRIYRIAKKIQKDTEYLPSPSARCSWCPYVVRCAQLPALEGLQLPALNSEEKAREYAGKLLVVKEALKRVEGMLKDYTKQHGPIELGDGAYGHHFTQSPKVKDVEGFMNRMWDAEKDPLPYLKVDMRGAKKLLGKVEGLEEIAEDVGKTRFMFKKNKGKS